MFNYIPNLKKIPEQSCLQEIIRWSLEDKLLTHIEKWLMPAFISRAYNLFLLDNVFLKKRKMPLKKVLHVQFTN